MDIDKLLEDALADLTPHKRDIAEALLRLQQSKIRIDFLISYYQTQAFKKEE